MRCFECPKSYWMAIVVLALAIIGTGCSGEGDGDPRISDAGFGDADSDDSGISDADSNDVDTAVFLGKKGSAHITSSPERADRVRALNAYWNYNWGLSPSEYQPDDIEFVPMIKGAGHHETPERQREHLIWAFDNRLAPQLESGSVSLLLGFNEPDVENQGDLTVDEALMLWPLLEATGLPLASPAAAGDAWIDAFMHEANERGLRVDYLAYHWYGRPEWWRIMNKLTRVHEKHGLPIILTEFAPAWWGEHDYTAEQSLHFAKNVLPWLEETEWIVGYSWFPFDVDNHAGGMSALFTSDGNLTPLGEYYASVTNENPEGDQSISIE